MSVFLVQKNLFLSEQALDRPFTRTGQSNAESRGQQGDVKFPAADKTPGELRADNGDNHRNRQQHACPAGQDAEDHRDAAEELNDGNDVGHNVGGRNTQLAEEHAGAFKAV